MERDWNKVLTTIKRKGKRRIVLKNIGKSLPIMIVLVAILFTFVFRSKNEIDITKYDDNHNEIKMVIVTNFIYDDDLGFFIDK